MANTESKQQAVEAPSNKPAPPEFVATVQDWVAGKSSPSAAICKPLVDDLKDALAERDSLNTKAQEADKGLRQLSAQMAALSGKVDGLVGALHRIETHASAP